MKPGIVKPAIIGGVILGVASVIPGLNLLNCLCCALAIAGGAIAAYFHVKESTVPLTSGDGALVGLLAGVIGAAVDALLSIPLRFVFFAFWGPSIRQVREALEQLPPEVPPFVRRILETMFASQPGMGLMAAIIGFFFALIAYSIFATIGGIIGIALFEKRKGPTYAPPPPPTA